MAEQQLATEQDIMVGLATQQRDEEFNEEHTRAPHEIPNHQLCGHCSEQVRFQNMQVTRDSKVTCIDCYNKDYRQQEHPEVKQFSRKMFQRLSQAEFAEAMQNINPGVARLTERAARNPKRSQDEVSQGLEKLAESQKKTLKASTDYIAAIGNGFSGWYCCRSEKSLGEVEILRVKTCQEMAWRTPTSAEKQHLHLTTTCSDVIVPMNHWFRGGVHKHYRCPINFCEFQPMSNKKGSGCGFYLVLYNSSGEKYFIRATPPMGMIENKVALLKLMFCEQNLPALMADSEDVADYWKVINQICSSEYAIMSRNCDQVEVRIRQPPFQIQETRASLNQLAVGRALKCTLIPKLHVTAKKWGDTEWEDFVASMFGHFRLEAVSQETLASLGKAQRRMLGEMRRIIPNKSIMAPGELMANLVADFSEIDLDED